MPKKVLILFSSSELGGAERSLTRMAMATKRLETEKEICFDVASLDGEGPWTLWCREQDMDPVFLGVRREGKAHGRFGVRTFFRLVCFMRREKYDALYVIGARASLISRFLRPFFLRAQFIQGVRWNPDSNSNLDKFFRFGERLFGWMVDLYICNSSVSAETLQNRVNVALDKIAVIHNGLIEIPDDIRDNISKPQHVLTLANLSERKGYIPYLEKVVAPLCALHADVKFFFVGRDEMNGAVQRRIKEMGLSERVFYPGFQSDVRPFLEEAKIFVLPSLWNEGCPTSILEAMSYCVPTVAFSIDGIPELVSHEKDGILVSLRDYDTFFNALDDLLRNPEKTARFGKVGRQKVSDQFTMKNMVQKHQNIYSELFLKKGAV